MTCASASLKSEWQKCVSENIQRLAAQFKDVNSNKERFELAKKVLQ
jgi:hypothetical protein